MKSLQSIAILMLIFVFTCGLSACSDSTNDSEDGDSSPDAEISDCETPPDWQSEDCYLCESDLDCAPIDCCGGGGINKTCAPDCSQKGCVSECLVHGLAFSCPREGLIRCIDNHCTSVYTMNLDPDAFSSAQDVITQNMGCYWHRLQGKDYNKDCRSCQSDDDCVASECCRTPEAVNKVCAPFCDYTQCEGCAPDTLDCGQNRIFCNENGHCAVEFDEQQDE